MTRYTLRRENAMTVLTGSRSEPLQIVSTAQGRTTRLNYNAPERIVLQAVLAVEDKANMGAMFFATRALSPDRAGADCTARSNRPTRRLVKDQ
eukprot:10796411-Alexandrium_andersonii.AAC.1